MAIPKQESNSDKQKMDGKISDSSGTPKEVRNISRAEHIQKLIKAKELETQRKKQEEAERKVREQERALKKQEDSFKIPKKTTNPEPEPAPVTDTEKFINSLFDDSGMHSDNSISGEDSKKTHDSKVQTGSSSHSSSSKAHKGSSSNPNHHDKSSSSESKHKKSSHDSDKHRSGSSSHKSSGSHGSSASSGSHRSSTSSGSHRSSSSSGSHHSSNSSKSHHSHSTKSQSDSKSKTDTTDHKKPSAESMEKSSKQKHDKERNSSGQSSKSQHVSSSKSKSSSSLSGKDKVSSNHTKNSGHRSSSSQSSSSGPKENMLNGTDKSQSNESHQQKVSHEQPSVLTKHHLNPVVERKATEPNKKVMSQEDKLALLARLKATREKTRMAIQEENKPGKRSRREPGARKSHDGVHDKLDENAKSDAIVRDEMSSSDDDDDDAVKSNIIPSALDIMLEERNAKTEKDKMIRMAKQAWERATKKDSGNSDKDKESKSNRKRKSENKNRVSIKTSRHSKSSHNVNIKKREHSISPTPENKSNKSISDSKPLKPKKPIVRHSGNAPPPMDFKALMAMAEQKHKEPVKPAPVIPKKKKKEEEERPMTQDEKDRKERIKSKEYQDWLKYGGKRPGERDESSDDEPSQKKPASSSSAIGKISDTDNKFTSLNKPISKQGSQIRVSAPKINENVLVCGDGDSKDKSVPGVALNPFDRICSQVHKSKKPAPRPQSAPKRMQIDDYDDEEEEEDSDMDGFIDDGDEGGTNISKEIQRMFGYDRSRFKDEKDDDLADMEANFSTIMKEEKQSARLGLKEDLEDIRQEQEELRQKALIRKQMKKKR